MLAKGFLKPEISIQLLSKRKFWTGIIIGIGYAFTISLFINYSREALRSLTYIRDFHILSESEFRLYDLFFAAFSTSLGFGLTVTYWFLGSNKNVKKKHLKGGAVTNSLFITLSALMIVTRFGTVLSITLFNFYGYDNHLDFLKEFWIILLLIPIFIFLSQWNSVRLFLKTRNWIFFSFVAYFILTFCVFQATTANRNILNEKYYKENKNRFDYIETEFEKATVYGIFFSDSLKQILQKRYSDRTTNLVLNIKNSFNNNRKVSLDTLILEKIIVHNMNSHGLRYYRRADNLDNNWSYALPEEIYYQIKKHKTNSIEVELLFEILGEQLHLFTAKEINWKDWSEYDIYERERSFFKEGILRRTETIQSRLIQISDTLRSEQQYENYWYLLPVIKFDDYRGRQKEVKLKITGAKSKYNQAGGN